MPPVAKFTKEKIIETALEIVSERGTEALTARELAKKLKSSSCPIFTVFRNMEEVRLATVSAARCLYNGYVKRGISEENAFQGFGNA